MEPIRPNASSPDLPALKRSDRKLKTHMARLAGGLRINSARDDPAGMAIAELLRADVRTLRRQVRNANDGISMLQTADGAMGTVSDSLVRMKELAGQAASGTLSPEQRQIVAEEYNALAEGIDATVNHTRFNGHHILAGEGAAPSIETEDGTVRVDGRMDLTEIQGMAFTTPEDALRDVEEAISVVGERRAEVGAGIHRLESTVSTLEVEAENLLASQSRIADADYARETAAITREQVQQQAAIAMQSQAWDLQASAVQLLG